MERSILLMATLAMTGCGIRKAMYDQPKYEPYQQSDFFGDNRSVRAQVEGTVSRGALNEDKHLHLGIVDGKAADTFPFAITRDDLDRGRVRYNIYCAPCHDQAGTGWGMVAQRGFKRPTSYHIDRLRQAPPGYFYDVINKGFGQMPSYAAQVKTEDRWRIVAYIRALQLSHNATAQDVPELDKAALEESHAVETESHAPGHS